MPPLYPVATITAATDRNMEAAHQGAPDNLPLILRFLALELDLASTMGTLRRQRHADGFIDPRGSRAAGVLPIIPARLAARPLRVILGLAAGMRCGLALPGPQGGFQFFAQPFVFLLEPFDLPALFFDLLFGLLQLLLSLLQLSLGNELNEIRPPSLFLLASRDSHPPHSSRNGGFCSAPLART
jgi:hypothetical protein